MIPRPLSSPAGVRAVAPDQLPTDAPLAISDLNSRVRRLIESSLPLLWVRGEISNLTYAASGHVYFSLKDDRAQARCVMFRSRAHTVGWRLANGQAVEARVLVSFYEPRGDFQLNVEALRQAGAGNLFERFLQLKRQLDAEGLFAPERKPALPAYPRRIGIITSPQAAALRDVVSTLRRRAPYISLRLYPSPVQGAEAAAQLAAALARANARRECDLLILCRGGGSLEDLWAFNQEVLARAIAASALPIISGVGHETDFTIADFVASVRAPTPTAAAEMAAPAAADLQQHLNRLQARLTQRARQQLRERTQRLDYLERRLRHPREQLARTRDRLAALQPRLARLIKRQRETAADQLQRLSRRFINVRPPIADQRERLRPRAQRLNRAIQARQERWHQQLGALATSLRQLDPRAVLQRGYAIVRSDDGRLIKNSAETKPGAKIVVHVAQGEFDAAVIATRPPAS